MTSSNERTLENIEEVLMELNNFEKKVSSKNDSYDIPPILDDYLLFVAKTGNTHFPWTKIKPLFKSKLEKVIHEFSQNSEEIPPTPNVDVFQFNVVRDKVFEQLEFFAGIPFTVQRLCELLTAPSKHYKRTDKFMRALEKNMLVVSTVEAVHPSIPCSGNVTSNGVDSFSSTLEQREREQQLQQQQQRQLLVLNGNNDEEEEEEEEKPIAAADSNGDDFTTSSTTTSTTENITFITASTTTNTTTTTTTSSSSPQSQNHIEERVSEIDLEASGPCDSGDPASSIEEESSNDGSSDSTTEPSSSIKISEVKFPTCSDNDDDVNDDDHDEEEEGGRKQREGENSKINEDGDVAMDIDAECSSSDSSRMIQTVETSEAEESPRKKPKTDVVDKDDVDKKDDEHQSSSPTSSCKEEEEEELKPTSCSTTMITTKKDEEESTMTTTTAEEPSTMSNETSSTAVVSTSETSTTTTTTTTTTITSNDHKEDEATSSDLAADCSQEVSNPSPPESSAEIGESDVSAKVKDYHKKEEEA